MTREEFNKLEFGDMVYKINHFSHTVSGYEVGTVKGKRALIGDQYLDYTGDLSASEIGEYWRSEKKALHRCLDGIDNLKKPINERLKELSE